MELKDIIKDYKYRHQLTNDEIAQKLGVTKSRLWQLAPCFFCNLF